MSRTCLITGANRGIGLEYARQLSERGDHVIATARSLAKADTLKDLARRSSGRMTLEELDVNSDRSVHGLAERLHGRAIDLLINNAGVLRPDDRLTDVSLDEIMRTFDTNVLGPIRVTRALLPHLSKSPEPKIVNMTSKMGSIAENDSGGYYAYRASKTALNMVTKNMAIEMRDAIVVCLHPGWVRTEMGGEGAPTTPEESVTGLLSVIDRIGSSQSGRFFDYRGEAVPY